MNTPENSTAYPLAGMPVGRIASARTRQTGPVEAGGITPRDIWLMIRRRLVLVIITAVIFSILGVGINLVWQKYFPRWPGVAWVKVDSPEVRPALGQVVPAPAALLELFLRSQANAIRSRQYAQDVLEDPKVRQTDWFIRNQKNAQAKFEKNLSVTPVRDTQLIQVSFSTRNKEDGPRIVNTLINIYLEDRRMRATADFDQKLRGLKNRRGILRTELITQTENIEAYIKDQKIPVLLNQQTEVNAKLAKMTVTYSDIKLGNEAAKAGWESMKEQDPLTWTPGSMQQAQIDNDPQVRTLKQSLLFLEQEREVRSKEFGSDHKYIKEIDRRIRVTKRDLDKQLSELRQRVFFETLQDYESAVTSNEKTLEQLDEELTEARDQQNELNPKILTYQGMQEAKRELARFIGEVDEMIKKTEATREQLRSRGGQVTLAQSAIPAPKMSSPNLRINIPASILLSILLGVGLAFMLEFLNKTIRSSMCIRRHIGLPCLGTVPALHEDEANLQDMYSVVSHAPRSLLAEAFRQIRTNIMFSFSGQTFRSMLVTSPSPKDGRTTVSVNLAASLALSGKKVLLIDGNFRKPAFSRLFPNLPSVGFAELIAGKATAEEAILATDTPALWVMASGNASELHAELLGSADIKGLIDQLGRQFDHIVVYGPPALLSADALTMAAQIESVLFVARARKNTHGEFNRMIEQVRRVNNNILGIVLNGVEATGGGYLRKSYRQFYDYQQALVEPVSLEASHAGQQKQAPPPVEEDDNRGQS